MRNPVVLYHALARQVAIYQVPDELPLERRAEMTEQIINRLIAESASVLGVPAELPDHIEQLLAMASKGASNE